MTNRLRLVLVLHAHQPVGNLDPVTEDIYGSCYLPLVETLSDFPSLPVNLHVSGSLVDWLAARHPEYVQRLRDLATAGRIELLGGAYHDPILPMLSHADRRGQIDSFSRRLGQLFGQRPRGMWLPERVWEPSLAADMAMCDIEHAVLDDFHFHAAGLTNDRLRGYYLSEAAGQLVALFAGDEQLRYLIPFAEPEDSIAYLRGIAKTTTGGVLVYADDAEKFGAWPGMHERMQQGQWLRRFLTALSANTDWLQVTTLGECIDFVPPLGKVYVPEGSYREMGHWSTLAGRGRPRVASNQPAMPGAATAAASAEDCQPAGDLSRLGTWRNFRVKYPEIDEMYCRMLAVSRRCEAAAEEATADETAAVVHQAQQALYRAQCGCAYWHGIFGGVYLPHLRQAVYQNLIEAEHLLDQAAGRDEPWLSATIDDFNLDVHKELQLANGKLALYLAPECGGELYELDVRDTRTNLLATLAHRPEPYHRQVAAEGKSDREPVAPPPVYDAYRRKSLLDHFYDPQTRLDDVTGNIAAERGDFIGGRYRARLRRTGDGVCAPVGTRRPGLGTQRDRHEANYARGRKLGHRYSLRADGAAAGQAAALRGGIQFRRNAAGLRGSLFRRRTKPGACGPGAQARLGFGSLAARGRSLAGVGRRTIGLAAGRLLGLPDLQHQPFAARTGNHPAIGRRDAPLARRGRCDGALRGRLAVVDRDTFDGPPSRDAQPLARPAGRGHIASIGERRAVSDRSAARQHRAQIVWLGPPGAPPIWGLVAGAGRHICSPRVPNLVLPSPRITHVPAMP